jgi:hypothetical protein
MIRVAILMPSCGQRGLANLARDAIARYNPEVAHDVFLLDHDPWSEEGSAANHRALSTLRPRLYGGDDYTHVFIMHDDALPLRSGWLSFLLSKPMPAAAMVSRRSGRGHSSGTLFMAEMFEWMELAPEMPEYDVAESVPVGWSARTIAWRPREHDAWALRPRIEPWMALFDCDLSCDDGFADGAAFYAHLGGGTIGATGTPPTSRTHRHRVESWIVAAREELGL